MRLLSNCCRSYLCSREAEILIDTRVAIVQCKPPSSVSLLVCLLCQLLWKTRCTRRTVDQSDGICYSYTIALSGLFELYARGRCLNHEAKPSGLNTRLERTIQ